MVDAHSHITITDDIVKNKKNIQKYINDMEKNGIDESIVTVNPFIDSIKCKNNPQHYVKMKDGNKLGEIICKCTTCQKTVYEGLDPFICYNNFLINELKDKKNIHVYPVVSVTRTSTQWLIDYYQDLYGNMLEGIKAYTGLSAYSLNEIGSVKCDKPMLVHAGTYPNQNPANMMEFIKNYDGIIQIAHLAGLELDTIKKLKKIESVLIDISPALYMYNYYVVDKMNGGLFNKEKISSLDDMYELLLNNFEINNIVWGSDVPYSALENELNAVKKSKVFTSNEKSKVLSNNIKRVLKW